MGWSFELNPAKGFYVATKTGGNEKQKSIAENILDAFERHNDGRFNEYRISLPMDFGATAIVVALYEDKSIPEEDRPINPVRCIAIEYATRGDEMAEDPDTLDVIVAKLVGAISKRETNIMIPTGPAMSAKAAMGPPLD